MRAKRALFALLLAASVATFARTLLASGEGGEGGERPRVAIVVAREDDRFAARIAAELSAVGLEPLTVADGGAARRGPLEEAARRAGAIAAVRIVTTPAGVEVWVVDRVTGKTVLRELVPDGTGSTGEDMVAQRAVELLRASLLEVRDTSHPSRGEVAAPPEALRLIAPRAPAEGPPQPGRRLWIGLGASYSPGGVETSAHAVAGLSQRLAGRLSVEALTLLPALSGRVSADEGTATVSKGLFGGGFLVSIPTAWPSLEASAGGGISAAFLRMDGAAAAPYRSSSSTVWAAFPYVRGGAALSLGGPLSLAAGALLGLASPRPVVAFAGREVASWGRPAAAAWLAVEIALP